MAHVQIDDITPRVSYTVGGSATDEFAIPFAFFSSDDIQVFVDDEQLDAADFTVSGTAVDGGYSGGTVTLDTAVTSATVVVLRQVLIERTSDYPESGPLRVRALNTDLDRLTAIAQEARLDLDDHEEQLEDHEDRIVTGEQVASDRTLAQAAATLAVAAADTAAAVGGTAVATFASRTEAAAQTIAEARQYVIVPGISAAGDARLQVHVRQVGSSGASFRSVDRYLPASSGGGSNATTGGYWREIKLTVANPTDGDLIIEGASVSITKADGSTHYYRALSTFTWSGLTTHEYGATPTLVPIHKERISYGACPAPTGFSAAPFGIYYTADRIQTAVDTDQAFRDTYLHGKITPGAGNIFYVDKDTGSNSDNGKTWAAAKASILGATGARADINTSAAPAIIFIKGIEGGGCYSNSEGMSFTNLINYDYALIGVPADDGSPCYVGNVYASSVATFTPTGGDPATDPVITGITQANPAVVTAVGHGFTNGTFVVLYDVAGMTQVNGVVYTVAGATADTFQLSGVDSTAYGAYTSGGQASKRIIYVTSTASMTAPGRACDLQNLVPIQDEKGQMHMIPMEYAAKTARASVAATPGSYWFDSANAKWYVHMIGGGAPSMNVDLVIPRSDSDAIVNAPNAKFYGENLRVIGGINANGVQGEAYLNRCMSLYSSRNGIAFEGQVSFGSKDCIAVSPSLDGFNYHNSGTNISAVTKANPTVLTVSSTTGLSTGDSMLVQLTTYGGTTGLDAILGTHTITVLSGTTVSIPIDTSAESGTYTAASAKLREVTSQGFELNASSLYAGAAAGSNQASTNHENCEVVTINGLFQAPWRDHFADIGTSKRWAIKPRLEGTKITAPNATYPKRFVLATDAAIIAIDRGEWGGYVESVDQLIEGNSNYSVRLLNTEVPRGSAAANVTVETW